MYFFDFLNCRFGLGIGPRHGPIYRFPLVSKAPTICHNERSLVVLACFCKCARNVLWFSRRQPIAKQGMSWTEFVSVGCLGPWAASCHQPGCAGNGKESPKPARSGQELPAGNCQELPGAARSCQELPRSCQEVPGVARELGAGSWELGAGSWKPQTPNYDGARGTIPRPRFRVIYIVELDQLLKAVRCSSLSVPQSRSLTYSSEPQSVATEVASLTGSRERRLTPSLCLGFRV